jgi:nitrite reductase/ring-hydroxylating ferredoxin subunit
MERRNVLTLAATSAFAAIAAACGASSSTSKAPVTTAGGEEPSGVGEEGSSSLETTTSTPESTATWPAIALASQVPVGGTVAFQFGESSAYKGDTGIIYQPTKGTFVALDTICPHQGGPCVAQGNVLVCQYHGSQFALKDGALLRGPATVGLSKATVEVKPDGYVTFIADA